MPICPSFNFRFRRKKANSHPEEAVLEQRQPPRERNQSTPPQVQVVPPVVSSLPTQKAEFSPPQRTPAISNGSPTPESPVYRTQDSTHLVKQMHDIPKSLPSQVEGTLGDCPRFRILVVGNSGVGKSSLIKNIFNVDPADIDIQDGRAGHATIEREFTSDTNPRFVLHDSKGFEPGSRDNTEIVRNFLETRAKSALPNRIHAIWLCMKTPLDDGDRLLQTGEESVLTLAKEFKIPIIAVFTQYDKLVNNRRRKLQSLGRTEDPESAASAYVNEFIEKQQVFDSTVTRVKVTVATIKDESKPRLTELAKKSLWELTNETRTILRAVEEKLQVLWVASQQVSARQKVDTSISEGFKKYWQDLGSSSFFEDQNLIDCILRIHYDVLKVWNLNDSAKVLSGTEFFAKMINLLKPLIDENAADPESVAPSKNGPGSDAIGILTDPQGFAFNHQAIDYLFGIYQPYPSTGKLLAAYVVNLVVILNNIFNAVLVDEPPRVLTNDITGECFATYEDPLVNIASADFEPIIKQEIKKRLGRLTSV